MGRVSKAAQNRDHKKKKSANSAPGSFSRNIASTTLVPKPDLNSDQYVQRNRPSTRLFLSNSIASINARSKSLLESISIQSFPNFGEQEKLVSGFTWRVRDYFLDFLPEINISVGRNPLYWCPWCMETTPDFAMHVDHITPKKIFAKYRLQLDARAKVAFGTANANDILRRYLNDVQNLVLSCATCNTRKGNKLVEHKVLEAFKTGAGSHMYSKQIAIKVNLANKIRNIYSNENADGHKFLISGNVNDIALNEQYSEYSSVRALASEIASWGSYGSSAPFSAREVKEAIKPMQKNTNAVGYRAKLCLYCLGFYHESVFQIDHIQPIPKSKKSKITNNIAENLFPVCSICNNFKSNKPLTFNLLVKMIEKRRNNNVPGLETTELVSGDTPAEKEANAASIQVKLFGPKISEEQLKLFKSTGSGKWMVKRNLLNTGTKTILSDLQKAAR